MGTGFFTASFLSQYRCFREPFLPAYDQRWGWEWAVVMGALGLGLMLMDGQAKRREGRGLTAGSWVCGAIFAVGLIVSHMVLRQKVGEGH